MRFRPFFLLIFLSIIQAGCMQTNLPPVNTPIPTEYYPTAIALTVAASGIEIDSPPAGTPTQAATGTTAPSPTATAQPTAEQPPTASPTTAVSPTPTERTAIKVPPADIEITTPGSLSKVTSPIPLRALLVPGFEEKVTIELIGEDGRLLTRQIVGLNGSLGRKAGLVIDIRFQIEAAAELGRLVIYTQDAFGRVTALNSVDLILLSSGASDYNAVIDTYTPVEIKAPQPEALIEGGSVILNGLARPVSGLDMVAELVTESGKIVGTRVFNTDDKAANEYGYLPYNTEIPYTVTEPVRALLIIRIRSDRIPGTIYQTSLEVILIP